RGAPGSLPAFEAKRGRLAMLLAKLAVLAAEIEQGLGGRVRRRLHADDAAEQQAMIATIVPGVGLAFERGEVRMDDRGDRAVAMMAGLPFREVAFGEGRRNMALVVAQKADGEMRRQLENLQARDAAGETDQDERRVERDRGEGIDRQAADAAVLERRR